MRKYLVLLISLLCWHTAEAQKKVVVYDLETRTPIQKARIRVDRMRTYSTDMLGTFVTPVRYDTLEVSTPKHLTCKLAATAVGDSIGLIPQAHTLNEVEVYADDLGKRLNKNLDLWTTQDKKEIDMMSSSSGVSFDLVKVFDFKGRARAKRTRKVKSALDKMEVDSDDPIEQAYLKTLKDKKKREEEE